MKAISLHQPWATLIADGHKTVETRSWRPPWDLIGHRIAIHAAKRPARLQEWPVAMIDRLSDLYPHRGSSGWPLGVVVATAILEAVGQVNYDEDGHAHCVYPSPARWAQIDPFGDFGRGRYLWFLTDVEPLPLPEKAVGRQGFWEWQ